MKSLILLAAMSALGALGYSQLPEKQYITPWRETPKTTEYNMPWREDRPKAEYIPPAPVESLAVQPAGNAPKKTRKPVTQSVQYQAKPAAPSFSQIYAIQYGPNSPTQQPQYMQPHAANCTPGRHQIMQGMPQAVPQSKRPVTGQAQTPWVVNGQTVRPAY